jgi:uncharacterized protein YhjY with autotransporter beta-barrel domain
MNVRNISVNQWCIVVPQSECFMNEDVANQGDSHEPASFSHHKTGYEWTWSLKHEMSLLARTFGSCVRIPLEAWMYV